ncbi:hypothetical protein [Micromonospora sp. 067-2]
MRLLTAAAGAALGAGLAVWAGANPIWLLLIAAVAVGLAQQALP